MKKLIAIALVVVLALSLGTIALAKNDKEGAAPTVEKWTDGFGFHCGHYGGNGRVWTGAESMVVDLVNVGGTAYSLQADILCPDCWRIDWVTYSNNNGKISGKNIQTQHSGDAKYYQAVVETYLVLKDLEGEIISSNLVEELSEIVDITKENTGFSVEFPDDLDEIEGFEFVGVTGIDGVPVGALIPENKGTYTVVYTYEEVEAVVGGDDEDDVVVCVHDFLCSNCNGKGKQCTPDKPHGQCETSNPGSWECQNCKRNANQIYGPHNIPSDIACGCPNQDPDFVDDNDNKDKGSDKEDKEKEDKVKGNNASPADDVIVEIVNNPEAEDDDSEDEVDETIVTEDE